MEPMTESDSQTVFMWMTISAATMGQLTRDTLSIYFNYRKFSYIIIAWIRLLTKIFRYFCIKTMGIT